MSVRPVRCAATSSSTSSGVATSSNSLMSVAFLQFRVRQTVRYPPSTAMVVPVMYEAASALRNSTAPDTVLGHARPRHGVWNADLEIHHLGDVEDGVRHPGVDQAGGDRVDADAVADPAAGQIHGERDQPGLGRAVAWHCDRRANADIETMVTTLAPPGAVLAFSLSWHAMVSRMGANMLTATEPT